MHKWEKRTASGKQVLIDYLASAEADRKLKQYLGLSSEQEILDRFDCNFYHLSGRDISQQEGFLPCWRGPQLNANDSMRECPLGIQWQRRQDRGKFDVEEAIRGPFTLSTTPKEVLAHRWPSAKDFDFEPLIPEAAVNADRIVISGLWSGIFGDSYRMIGFDQFLLGMAMNPDLIHAIANRMTEMYLELNERLFQQLKGHIDIWFFGNDFGSQEGLLFSTEMWDDFFGKNIRQLCQLAHAHGLKVMKHSCGSVAPLLERLCEAGVDILDPVQLTARGMEPETLMREYGDRLVFHGGVDTQHVLPNATPDQVGAHVQDIIGKLSGGCGYIVAPSQIFQKDIPVENIVAAYDAAIAYNNKETSSWQHGKKQ